MEEFRRAHRRMFNSREDLTSEDDDTTAMSSRTSPLIKSQPWSERSGGLASSSPSLESPSSPARPSTSTFNSSCSSSSNSSSSMSSSSLNLASARANLKPLSDSAAADRASLKEFSVTDGPKATPRPPDTYFEQPKSTKPNVLVSIGTYPTANQRPAPQKMDFLPKGAQNPQNTRTDGAGSKDHLQNELSQTLDRSNLRQRCVPLELPPEASGSSSMSAKVSPPVTSPSSTSPSSTSSSVTSATSLSSKYRGLGSEAAAVAAAASAVGGTSFSSSGSARPSVTINIKGNDEQTTQGPASSSSSSSSYPPSPSSSPSCSPSVDPESPPGILKGRGTPSKNTLHKTISFGDVTTVNDDSIRL